MILKSHALIAAVASMSWFIAPAALSQEPPEEQFPPSSTQDDLDQAAPPESTAQPTEPTPPADAAALDDRKIEQFADAYIAVQTIQQKAATEMQSTTDPAAADKVRATAENDMIAAVERSGLQVDEFNQIVETMASNVELRNKVAAKLQERSGG